MTSRDPERSNSWPEYAYSAISQKLLELETSNLVCSFVWSLAGAQIIFPESERGLGRVIATIFGSTVGYPSDSLASCYNGPTQYLTTDIDCIVPQHYIITVHRWLYFQLDSLYNWIEFLIDSNDLYGLCRGTHGHSCPTFWHVRWCLVVSCNVIACRRAMQRDPRVSHSVERSLWE